MTWTNAIIGDLVEPKVDQGGPSDTEFTYVDISSIDNATKRVADPKRLPREKAPSRARQRLRARDVVVSMTRPNLNAVALLPSELDGAIGSTGFDVLRAKPGVEPAWLYYAVQTPTFIHTMSGVVQGTLYPAVRPKDIRDFPLIVPPLDDQRRIVAEIEEQLSRIEAGVAALKRVHANLKRYRAAVLADAVCGKFRQIALGELARDAGYGTSVKCAYSPDGIGVLRIPNISSGKIDTTDMKRAPVDYAYKPDDPVEPGDLLIIRTNGSKSLIGRGAVVLEATPEPLLFASYLIRLRLNGTRTLWRWVSLALESPVIRAWIETKAASSAGQHNISLTILRSMPLPLPSASEQERILSEVDRRLSVVEELETQVRADLARAERLRQAALAQAFAPDNRSR